MEKKYSEGMPSVHLGFESFWAWLQDHYNCIVRAGTPDVILYDRDEYHWRLSEPMDEGALIQLCKGKGTVGEMMIFPNRVTYVQSSELHGDEFLFELVYEDEEGRDIPYFIVLLHGYEEEPPAGQWMN